MPSRWLIVVEVSQMPMVSKAQSRKFHWAEEHPAEAAAEGLKPSVVKEFITASHGEKIRNLPEHVAKKAHGGRATAMPSRPTGY